MKEDVSSLLEEVMNDRGVPRNIKTSIENSIKILDEKETEDVKLATIIAVLDEAANDPNLSFYARTKIWNIVSTLETMKKNGL